MQRIADSAKERLKTRSTSDSVGLAAPSGMNSSRLTAHSDCERRGTEVGATVVRSTPRGYVPANPCVQLKLEPGHTRRDAPCQAGGVLRMRATIGRLGNIPTSAARPGLRRYQLAWLSPYRTSGYRRTRRRPDQLKIQTQSQGRAGPKVEGA